MALRAFHSNPSIGGFGGESSPGINLLRSTKTASAADTGDHSRIPDGDAFCQIIKELVDNAVDAVTGSINAGDNDDPANKQTKRIRVEIKPYNDKTCNNSDDDHRTTRTKLLQVSVSDNGIGIQNIQNCVNAFFSRKDADTTSGRYGIGLTLCLIHAQRLVPNSYCCITSTRKGWKHHKRAFFIVDTIGDLVVCHHEERIPKFDSIDSSGTCVSLLVPVRFAALRLAHILHFTQFPQRCRRRPGQGIHGLVF
jgi:DNA topoisomerase VI subunit B